MAENKKATIRRLTVLRDRLLIIGIVLAVTSGVCTQKILIATVYQTEKKSSFGLIR